MELVFLTRWQVLWQFGLRVFELKKIQPFVSKAISLGVNAPNPYPIKPFKTWHSAPTSPCSSPATHSLFSTCSYQTNLRDILPWYPSSSAVGPWLLPLPRRLFFTYLQSSLSSSYTLCSNVTFSVRTSLTPNLKQQSCPLHSQAPLNPLPCFHFFIVYPSPSDILCTYFCFFWSVFPSRM